DAAKPFPLQAQVKIADTSIALAGTLTDPLNLGALDLRLKLAGSSLGNLYPLTGVTLPDSPASVAMTCCTDRLEQPTRHGH
ncbi:AsmA family protein, partial [Klebsiella pneumoniae]|uniref:AsmA family protein n=1 Tax=Klebsiella pneumoniae TaxID=573 RepID=UPI0027321E9D